MCLEAGKEPGFFKRNGFRSKRKTPPARGGVFAGIRGKLAAAYSRSLRFQLIRSPRVVEDEEDEEEEADDEDEPAEGAL